MEYSISKGYRPNFQATIEKTKFLNAGVKKAEEMVMQNGTCAEGLKFLYQLDDLKNYNKFSSIKIDELYQNFRSRIILAQCAIAGKKTILMKECISDEMGKRAVQFVDSLHSLFFSSNRMKTRMSEPKPEIFSIIKRLHDYRD